MVRPNELEILTKYITERAAKYDKQKDETGVSTDDGTRISLLNVLQSENHTLGNFVWAWDGITQYILQLSINIALLRL